MITTKLESPSAEQLVLASILENNGLHDDIGGLLGADDFTVPEYRAVWGAITDLKNLRRSFDPVQAAGYMLDRGWTMRKRSSAASSMVVTPDARQPSAMRNASGNIPFYAT